uniref:ARS-binding protein 1 N-terminal domain-containing protein n=1 Tax=Peronospora matthiolae TaxID=2874970 RepID=A0AAV1T984_9STRA
MSQIRLTNEQKLRICKHQDANPRITQTALAAWTKDAFDLQKALSQAAISKIIKKGRSLRQWTPLTSALSVLGLSSTQLWRRPSPSGSCSACTVGSLSLEISYGPRLRPLRDQRASRRKTSAFRMGGSTNSSNATNCELSIHGESGSADMGALEEALPHLKAVVAGYAPRTVQHGRNW